MASAAQTLANNDKRKLSANQLAALKQAGGDDDEASYQSTYGQLLKIYCYCSSSF